MNKGAIKHRSIANPEVQARRTIKRLPGGKDLHDYVNLYFNPRNAMMYRVRKDETVCVLQVSSQVMNLDGVFYSSRNAAVSNATFRPCAGITRFEIDEDHLHATTWVDPLNDARDTNRMEIMQAEILVPNQVPPEFIEAICVRSRKQQTEIECPIDIRVEPFLFFE